MCFLWNLDTSKQMWGMLENVSNYPENLLLFELLRNDLDKVGVKGEAPYSKKLDPETCQNSLVSRFGVGEKWKFVLDNSARNEDLTLDAAIWAGSISNVRERCEKVVKIDFSLFG